MFVNEILILPVSIVKPLLINYRLIIFNSSNQVSIHTCNILSRTRPKFFILHPQVIITFLMIWLNSNLSAKNISSLLTFHQFCIWKFYTLYFWYKSEWRIPRWLRRTNYCRKNSKVRLRKYKVIWGQSDIIRKIIYKYIDSSYWHYCN